MHWECIENAWEWLANTWEYLQMLENDIQTWRLSCQCLANSYRFQCEHCTFDTGGVARVAKMVENAPSSLVLAPIYISNSAMTEANGNTGRVGFSTCCSKKNMKEGSSSPNIENADKECKDHVEWEKQRRMLANAYKCFTITANALPSIRMACAYLRKCCERNENMLS